MDALLELRQGSVSAALCALCQKKKNENARPATASGLAKLRECLGLRREKFDSTNDIVIANLDALLEKFDLGEISGVVTHHSCYSAFTSKERISRLEKKRCDVKVKQSEQDQGSCSSSTASMKIKTRSSVGSENDHLCVFCQEDTNPSQLRTCQSKNIHADITMIAKTDYDVLRRTVKGFDGMSSEIKYHTYCLANRKRNAKRLISETPVGESIDVPYNKICQDLRICAAKGQVLHVSAVFQRYEELASDLHLSIPPQYTSRPAHFKEKLQASVGDVYEFFRPNNLSVPERKTLMIPRKYAHHLTVGATNIDNDQQLFPSATQDNDFFRELVHVALRLRGDLAAHPGHTGLNVSITEAAAVVPNSVHLFLSILLGGDDAINSVFPDEQYEGDSSDDDEPAEGDHALSQILKDRVLSISQDLVYAASKGRKLTPKHLGLAAVLHQRTRSKQLVKLFSRAGHTASYEQVLRMDTAMGKLSLKNLHEQTGAVIPPNLVKVSPTDENIPLSSSSVLHITADNIDILTDTLDGKNTFHATQMVAFKRGCAETDKTLRDVQISQERTLKAHPALSRIFPCSITPGNIEPLFSGEVQSAWYEKAESDIVIEAKGLEFAFLLQRRNQVSGWTEYHKINSVHETDISHVGYLPLILNPAHAFETLNTVLLRSLLIGDQLGHKYIVLTVDQNLYCRILELKWGNPVFQERLILRMGGLHLSMNFIATIGQHVNGSGILEVWIESGLLGEGAARKVLEGKGYSKGMRAHKLTYQALWRIIMPKFLEYLSTVYPSVTDEDINSGELSQLYSKLKPYDIQEHLKKFVKIEGERDVNFQFWWSYIEMVETLLLFTRSMRDGIWELYLHSLSEMLPFICWYDHLNYLKNMAVYIAEMHQLPDDIQTAFRAGDFVVKRSHGKFNCVDPDHAQEWLVGEGKGSGGLVGITSEEDALQRWALSYHWRSDMAQKTMAMFHLVTSSSLHAELYPGRRKRDEEDEETLLAMLRSLNIFSWSKNEALQNIVTNDLATEPIKEALLQAKENGRKIALSFVHDRLGPGKNKSYFEPVKKNAPLTFKNLHISKPAKNKSKKVFTKADRTILKKMLSAFKAGRTVNTAFILKHELLPTPPALFDADGMIRSGAGKASLLHMIIKDSGVECPSSLETAKTSTHLIVDGMALVASVGKPNGAGNFGDLADKINARIKTMAKKCKRVDLVFDRYVQDSIKTTTRVKRSEKSMPVRRIIKGRNTPLPVAWDTFTALPANKADLARFLSDEILLAHGGDNDLEVVVSGGFDEARKVVSTNPHTDLSMLSATHEEADSRLGLHAVHSPYPTVVVSVRDTDVFVILLHHYGKMSAAECWMMAGTEKKRLFIPIHAISKALTPKITYNLPAFHAVTGCDVTSFIAGISKEAAYKVYCEHSWLLSQLGVEPLTEEAILLTERFLVKLYTKLRGDVDTLDEARDVLFSTVTEPEKLPPTSDAGHLHIKRAHLQTYIWRNANIPEPDLPSPLECGWHRDGEVLKPTHTTLPSVPKACIDLLSCKCKAGCKTMACSCRALAEGPCLDFCFCRGHCFNGSLVE